MLKIFCTALTVFDAFIQIFRRNKKKMKILLDGIKPSWKTYFLKLQSICKKDIYLLSNNSLIILSG